jgi:hypothetical protein
MGRVYLARDRALGRLVALKAFRGGPLLGDPADSTALRRRVLREAQQAGMLSHPNVITIHDVVEADDVEGNFYIVMEYVEGEGLDARLRSVGPLEVAQVAPLVSQIAAALDHLHARGIVHRDVKPANVLVTPDGRVKITDFGVARSDDPAETSEEDIYGTPQYMAPEQIQGRPLDARTDVFALGVLLQEALTGQKPFPGTTVAEVTHRIVYEPPVAAMRDGIPLPSPLAAVLARALAKDPADRFPTAGALAEALRAIAEGRSELDLAATAAFPRARWKAQPASRGERTPRLHVVLTATLVAVALLAGAGAAYLRRAGGRESTASSRELEARQAGYVKLIAEGRRLLDAGDPQAAVLLFQSAEGLAVHPARARDLRLQAERAVEEQGKSPQLIDPRADLAAGRYDRVIAAARNLMATRGGRDQAMQVLAQVQQALEQQSAAAARARRARAEDEAASAEGSELVGPPAPPPATGATLRVELRSDAPAGVLSVWVDERQIVHQPFSFYEHTGFLGLRRRPASGSWEEDLPLAAGSHPVRVLLARSGEPAHVESLLAELQPGALRTLGVYVPRAGETQVALR